jgi:hypothetical protein
MASMITSNMGCSLPSICALIAVDQPRACTTLMQIKMRKGFAVAGGGHLPMAA